MAASAWPKRSEVEAAWRAVLAGELSREDGHAWAARWVEAIDTPRSHDRMVNLGLLYLHGFDMASRPESPNLIHHGRPGEYRKSWAEIASDLDEWLATCREYDRDPVAWRAEKVAAAKAAAALDRRREVEPDT